MTSTPSHEEIIQRAKNILTEHLGDMQDAMDELADLLESANYIVTDNDEDWAQLDEFFGFIAKKVVEGWGPAKDPFVGEGE